MTPLETLYTADDTPPQLSASQQLLRSSWLFIKGLALTSSRLLPDRGAPQTGWALVPAHGGLVRQHEAAVADAHLSMTDGSPRPLEGVDFGSAKGSFVELHGLGCALDAQVGGQLQKVGKFRI